MKKTTRAYAADLKRYHQGRNKPAYVFVQKKNIEKRDKKDRVKYYEHCQSCYINSYLNRRVLPVTDRDFWISACEYKYKVKEPQEMHIECIQLSFFVIDPRKSEFDFVPTLEQEIEFLLERARKFNLPKPEIVSDGEKLEVKWVWTDVMSKAGGEKDFDFSLDFDAIQEKLFRLFWDLGVDSKKLFPTTMLRVPGTLNTSKNTRVRVVLESDERISHKKFKLLLDEALSDNEENAVRSGKNLAEAPYIKEALQRTDAENIAKYGVDLLSLHCESENFVCICTESEASGWQEEWVQAKDVVSKLEATLKTASLFNDCVNVYISQSEFTKPNRKIENVATLKALFVDLDGKIKGSDLTAEEWEVLIMKHCVKNKIPIPSEIVFSCNGSHVKYIFTRPIPRTELKRWKNLEKILYELFQEIGADSKATDAARVLRVPGTKNCKPDTKDRDVRTTYTGAFYGYEEIALEFEELVKPAEEKVEPPLENVEISDGELILEDLAEISEKWLYVRNRTTHEKRWVSKSGLKKYLSEQDKNHQFECSIVEYSHPEQKNKCVDNFRFSYVILTHCTGKTFDDQLAKIKAHCLAYRGVGIPEPNRILQDGHNLILLWCYSKESSGQELPGKAYSRWRLTQEYLTHYFEDLGALEFPDVLESRAMLPLTGFIGTSGEIVTRIYDVPAQKYIFDTLATAVLPFTQEEVREYKKHKERPRRFIELEPLTREFIERREEAEAKSTFNPSLKIFNDIVKLLQMRRNESGEVPQGYRELCVFYAMDEAVQARLVITEKDFDELTLRLINLCGQSFTWECHLKTFMTLKNKFLNGEKVYWPRKKTIIKDLGIKDEEQAVMDILKLPPERPAKRKKIPIWELLGKTKTTYYRHEKQRKERAERFLKFIATIRALEWTLKELSKQQNLRKIVSKNYTMGINFSHIMRGVVHYS